MWNTTTTSTSYFFQKTFFHWKFSSSLLLSNGFCGVTDSIWECKMQPATYLTGNKWEYYKPPTLFLVEYRVFQCKMLPFTFRCEENCFFSLLYYTVHSVTTFVCRISGILGHRKPDSNSNWLCISNTTNTIGILYFRSTWLIRGGISLQFSSDLSAENCQDFRWRKSLLQQETNPGVSNCFLHTKAFDYYWLGKKVFLSFSKISLLSVGVASIYTCFQAC